MSDKCEIVPRVGGFVKISDLQPPERTVWEAQVDLDRKSLNCFQCKFQKIGKLLPRVANILFPPFFERAKFLGVQVLKR